MGRKWEVRRGLFAWNFEVCEEVVLIAAYEDVKGFIPPTQRWKTEFETHYYDYGNAVSFTHIDNINGVLRRRRRPELQFAETDVAEFGRSSDKRMRATTRLKIREQLAAQPPAVRQTTIAYAQRAMSELPPPHLTFDKWKDRRDPNPVTLPSAAASRVIRATVPSAAIVPATAVIDVERAVKMLSLTSDPETRKQIIASLNPDDALAAAQRLNDPAVREALVAHALRIIC